MAKAEISEFGGRKTLVIERFDRRWTKDDRLLRLPQEDCCQALSVPPTRKYQSNGGPGMRDIINLLKGSDTPESDIATFMRANIVFWLLGATDGHAKNFSIFLSPGGRFRLTPLYDVLTAQPSLDAGQIQQKKFKLAMSVGKHRHYAVHDVVPRHFLQTADLAGVGVAVTNSIFDEIAALAKKRLPDMMDNLPRGLSAQLIDSTMAAVSDRARLLS